MSDSAEHRRSAIVATGHPLVVVVECESIERRGHGPRAVQRRDHPPGGDVDEPGRSGDPGVALSDDQIAVIGRHPHPVVEASRGSRGGSRNQVEVEGPGLAGRKVADCRALPLICSVY